MIRLLPPEGSPIRLGSPSAEAPDELRGEVLIGRLRRDRQMLLQALREIHEIAAESVRTGCDGSADIGYLAGIALTSVGARPGCTAPSPESFHDYVTRRV